MWQHSYNSDPQIQKLSRNFDSYKTIDWRNEKLLENKKYYNELKSKPSLTFSRPSTQDSIITTISTFHISTLKLIQSRIWSTFQIWFVLTIVGIIIGSIAAIVTILTEFFNSIKLGICLSNIYLTESTCPNNDWYNWSNYSIINFLIFTIISTFFGLLASYLCISIEPLSTGSGISEIKCIVSGFWRDEFLSMKVFLLKAFTLPLTIASGLSVGKEGPSVHYASCIGNIIGKNIINWIRESPIQLSDIIISSAGTGVAVAFGSPIGGVLFSIEEISGKVKLTTLWKTFYTSLIAVSTLKLWNPLKTGQIVMFSVSYNIDWSWLEIFWFIIIGIFGGIYGIITIKYNIKYVSFRQKFLNGNPIKEIGILCLITSIIGYWNPFLRLEMTKVMEILFNPCNKEGDENNEICMNYENQWLLIVFQLILATIIRILLVIISYGSKVPCGIFVPSMTIGCTFGKLLGILVKNCGGNINSGIYSFLGAVAALSGITGLTFTIVVIMIELTGAVKYIIPCMITILTVKIITEIFGNGFGGIADQMIKFNGMPFIDLNEEHRLNIKVRELMVPQVICIDYEGMWSNDLLKVLKYDKGEYPVVEGRKNMMGVLKREVIEKILNDIQGDNNVEGDEIGLIERKFINFSEDNKYGELIETEFLELDINSSAYMIFEIFTEIGSKNVYINEEGKLVGIITRKDLIRFENFEHYNKEGEIFVNEQDEILMDNVYNKYINRII